MLTSANTPLFSRCFLKCFSWRGVESHGASSCQRRGNDCPPTTMSRRKTSRYIFGYLLEHLLGLSIHTIYTYYMNILLHCLLVPTLLVWFSLYTDWEHMFQVSTLILEVLYIPFPFSPNAFVFRHWGWLHLFSIGLTWLKSRASLWHCPLSFAYLVFLF